MKIDGKQQRVLEDLAAGRKPDTKRVRMMPLYTAGLVDNNGQWNITSRGMEYANGGKRED